MSPFTRAICPFCSLGCTYLVVPERDSPYLGESGSFALDYDLEGPVNGGTLCAKGNMALELLSHPRRLEGPFLGRGKERRAVSWSRAMASLGDRLEEIRDAHGAPAIGILAGPYLTMEEARLAAGLALSLGTENLDSCVPEDRGLLRGPSLARACPAPYRDPREIAESRVLLVVGDLFTVAPCLSKPVLQSRYDRRQNVLGVLESSDNRTAWFAKPHLRPKPAREAVALALLLRIALDRVGSPNGDALDEALGRAGFLREASGLDDGLAESFVESLLGDDRSGVLLVGCFAGREREVLVGGLSALLAQTIGGRFLAVPTGANSVGVRIELGRLGFPGEQGLAAAEMFEAAATGDLKALLVLGCDPLAALPDRLPRSAAERLEFLAVSAAMPGETTDLAHLLLPACAWGEKEGTVRNSFRNELRLESAMKPAGDARPDLHILEELLRRFGGDLPSEGAGAGSEGGGKEEATPAFFQELDLYLRMLRRGRSGPEAGTHLLLPRFLPPHSGDGSWTRHLSWPRHEFPDPLLSVTPEHAAKLGLRRGDPVVVRSRKGEAGLRLRVERSVPDGAVMASPHYPEVRRLVGWRLDPVLGELDLVPERVSVEPGREAAHE